LAESKWQDLGARTASALILIPAVLADVWAGGMYFITCAALIGILIAKEWVDLVHGGDPQQFALHAGAALVGALQPGGITITLAILAILTLICAAMRRSWNASRWCYFGVPYVGLPMLALVVLREDALHGIAAIIFLLIVVWIADTAAFFAGRMIGGPKLWPAVSPKKTWAGLGGAIAGGALAAGVFGWAGDYGAVMPLVLIGGLLGFVEQGGDLFESALKRYFNVKDSARLIPGHGGMLDRVDGLIAAAIVAAAIGLARGGEKAAGLGLLAW
jgi:phosphatidate cytidylyltransferase